MIGLISEYKFFWPCLYRLGTSKQKWTDEEEKALRAGVEK